MDFANVRTPLSYATGAFLILSCARAYFALIAGNREKPEVWRREWIEVGLALMALIFAVSAVIFR